MRHVGDRGSDIYELFHTAQDLGTHFLVRTCADRLAGDGDHTVADGTQEVRLKGVHRVEVRDGKGRIGTARVELRCRPIRVLLPIGKQKRYPALTLTVIHAKERGTPVDQPAIEWKLIGCCGSSGTACRSWRTSAARAGAATGTRRRR